MSKRSILAICVFAVATVAAVRFGAIAYDSWHDHTNALVEPVADGKRPAPIVENFKAIDWEIVRAYEKLGGTYGHWWIDTHQQILWSKGFEPPAGWEQWELNPPSRELAGFEFHKLPTEKLPDVDVGFGLYLVERRVTDAELKELKQMKNLKLIELDSGKVFP